ncbi:hypothetical protein BDR07DRAFT_620922 [Suillus spraguei]|nr:hypothetical protein BDR07DRAFT_620922 [Suillus spraguei]
MKPFAIRCFIHLYPTRTVIFLILCQDLLRCLPYVVSWFRFHSTFAYCHRSPSSFLSFSYPMQAQSRLKYCHTQ